MAVAVALNLLLGRDLGIRALGRGWHGIISLLAAAIVIGSLYVINGWDLPTYLGLALLALAFQQWHAHGRRYSRLFLLDLGAPVLILVALTFLLYLPFYREFVSPSQGIGLVPLNDRSPIGDEIAMFGLPLFLALSFLFLWGARELAPRVPRSASRSAPGTLVAGLGLAPGLRHTGALDGFHPAIHRLDTPLVFAAGRLLYCPGPGTSPTGRSVPASAAGGALRAPLDRHLLRPGRRL